MQVITIFVRLILLYLFVTIFYILFSFWVTYFGKHWCSLRDCLQQNDSHKKVLTTIDPISNWSVVKHRTVTTNTRTIFDYEKENISRPDTCKHCFLLDFKFLTLNKICKIKDLDRIETLFIITSLHDHFQRREALRSTWLKYTVNNTSTLRYLFILGQCLNTSLRQMVLQENAIHGDIIEVDFVESYRNLTLKTMLGLKFAVSYCDHAKFVMKTDDDVFVNVPVLMKILKYDKRITNKTVFGKCIRSLPIRDKLSKWYVSLREYNHRRYPRECVGPLYGLSTHAARRILQMSPSVPYFHLEDVYIGIVLVQLRFHTYNLQETTIRSHLKSCNALFCHPVNVDDMYIIWHYNITT